MLEFYFSYRGVLKRLRSGALGADMDRIADFFSSLGYKRASAKIYLSRIARFSRFAAEHCDTGPIDEGIVDRYLGAFITGPARIGAVSALQHARRIAPARFIVASAHMVDDPDAPLLTSFADYLTRVRGLEPKSRDGVLLAARRFLVWLHQHHPGQDVGGLTAEQVLAAVEHRMSLSATSGARTAVVSHFRSLLRFLHWAGRHDQDLARVVPRTPHWRLAHLPPRLSWDDVRRAIDAIGAATPIDLRDRAVLLLLATTGIRNGELRALRLEDIDWRSGEILVRRTKGKRDRVAPLLDETGAALTDYLLRARPKANSPYVFLSLTPPVGPFKFAASISRIVRNRLQRGGIEIGRVAGAHLLRHSLATQLVARRRPINEVADLLGHRSINTTALYVKVATSQLAEVALPFPGRRSMTDFAAFLGEKVERYIELRRSLGYAFDKQAGTLRAFVRHAERAGSDAPATRAMALDFVLSFGGAANSRSVRHGVLRRFYEHLAIYDPCTALLERRAFVRSRAIPPPRILSEAELTSLLDACDLISPNIPLRSCTLATLIGLLASTGLRSGEAVRLDRGDVDLTSGIVIVRKTKFRKDRLVPVHLTTQAALRRYARERDATFPTPKGAAFFLSSRGCRLSASGLQTNFAKARKHAGLDEGKSVRLHDLRHRFAVTRLALWHQQRADVQALLPLLATYLGHASYSDTAYYLTGSSELLAIAAERAFLDGGAA